MNAIFVLLVLLFAIGMLTVCILAGLSFWVWVLILWSFVAGEYLGILLSHV